MKKILRQIGGSVGIWFNAEERKIYNMKKGRVLEFEIKAVNQSAEDNQC